MRPGKTGPRNDLLEKFNALAGNAAQVFKKLPPSMQAYALHPAALTAERVAAAPQLLVDGTDASRGALPFSCMAHVV